MTEVWTEGGTNGRPFVEASLALSTVDGVTVLEEVLGEEKRLRLLTTAVAVSLSTGKSPGFKLQLGIVAMLDDSTNCRLGFKVDL